MNFLEVNPAKHCLTLEGVHYSIQRDGLMWSILRNDQPWAFDHSETEDPLSIVKTNLLYDIPWRNKITHDGETQRYEGEMYHEMYPVPPQKLRALLSFRVNYAGLAFFYDLLLRRYGHSYDLAAAARLAPNCLFIEFYSDLDEVGIRKVLEKEFALGKTSLFLNEDFVMAMNTLQNGPMHTNVSLAHVDHRHISAQEAGKYLEACGRLKIAH
jgi:hypothetical protein